MAWRGVAAALIWAIASFVPALGGDLTLRYAQNFTIEDAGAYRMLTIRNTWVGAGEVAQRYALVPRSQSLPALDEDVVVVRTPVQRTVILETVFLGPIHDLNLYGTLVGMGYVDYANDPVAVERVKNGLTRSIPRGSEQDVERMMVLRPDAILTSTTGSAVFDAHTGLRRAGLPVIVSAAYMEQHPLARTEWIKCIAALYGKDEEAARIFDRVADRYEALARLAAGAAGRPRVMCNAPYGGVWHVPGGKSYTAKAIADAGGDYIWARLESSGGMPLDLEVILRDAADADVWLHPSHHDTLSALTASDPRFVGFSALREGQVFNHTLRVNENGGNDIYERGVSRPDEVLADLIAIFHPELLPDHEFVFYEQLQ